MATHGRPKQKVEISWVLVPGEQRMREPEVLDVVSKPQGKNYGEALSIRQGTHLIYCRGNPTPKVL